MCLAMRFLYNIVLKVWKLVTDVKPHGEVLKKKRNTYKPIDTLSYNIIEKLCQTTKSAF